MESVATSPHLVIVGGGFAGLWATRALASAPLRITLVDRSNHHLFQPLLYQVATAGLSAPDIAAPLRHILRRQRNVTVLMQEAVAVEAAPVAATSVVPVAVEAAGLLAVHPVARIKTNTEIAIRNPLRSCIRFIINLLYFRYT